LKRPELFMWFSPSYGGRRIMQDYCPGVNPPSGWGIGGIS
jgi:hypothetical protein